MPEKNSLQIQRMFSAVSFVPFSKCCHALQKQCSLGEYDFTADLKSIWAKAPGDGIELPVQARLTSANRVHQEHTSMEYACLYGFVLLTDGRDISFEKFEAFLSETLRAPRVHSFHPWSAPR